MPRWPWNRAARLDKALSLPAGAATTFTSDQVAALMATASVGGQTTGVAMPLPRLDPQVAFGPGRPLLPAALDPLRPDTGRPNPRITEYPVSFNLPGVSDRLVPWKVLRDAAGAGGLPRRCIEIRKAEVATIDWAIVIAKGAVEQAQADAPHLSRADVEEDLRDRLGPEIARCSAFWEEPDREQGENTVEWLSKLLEEHLVLDAIAVWPMFNRGGDLHALQIVDGSTIKALLDYRGARPAAPNPAYQQVLWGFPRGEFVADTDDDGRVVNGYGPDRLIYKRRNVRTTTPYGYSAVEQALEDIDLWLRRRAWIRAEYAEGTIPAGWLKNTGVAQWTPEQTLEYERDLNDTYSGQTAARHRLRVLPPGFDVETFPDAAEKYKPEYDLFLIKQVAGHFDTTIAELGFTEAKGLGSTGFHEGQADVQQRRATLPTLRWLAAFITAVSRKYLRMPAELEFKFLGLEEEDEAAADTVADTRVRSGRMTLNEDRDRLGLPRFDFAEADMPMVIGQRGVVFLEGASAQAPPGEMIEPRQAGDDSGGEAAAPPAGGDAEPDAGGDEEADGAQAVKAELAAFRRWSRRNPEPHRRFQFTAVTAGDAPHLASDPRVMFKAASTSPKAPGPATWPGWHRDEETAAVWARRLRRAIRGAVDTRALAEAWLARTLFKDDEPDLTGFDDDPDGPDTFDVDPAGWLAEQHINLAAGLVLIRSIWTEGYAIGYLSATATVSAHGRVDWSAWRPGDEQAALLVLDENGRNGLALLLDQAGVTINSIAAHRMDALAAALSEALARGDSVDALARTLRGVLDDPKWADLVAVTETARATSAATLNVYRANGVAEVQWLIADGDACPICRGNADAGPVPTGTPFPSGDPASPAHPRCRCALSPLTPAPFGAEAP